MKDHTLPLVTSRKGSFSGSLKGALLFGAMLTLAGLTGCDDDGLEGEAAGTAQVVGTFSYPQTAPNQDGPGIDRVVEIRNVGVGTLKLANLDEDYDRPEEFKLFYFRNGEMNDQFNASDMPSVIELEKGESLGLVLNYKPVSLDGAGGELVFETTDPNQRTLTLPIRGDDTGAQIVVSPGTVDFGRVAAQSPEFRDLNVTNVGQANLLLEDFVFSGAPDFTLWLGDDEYGEVPSIKDDPDADGAPGISPGNTAKFRVRYLTEADGSDRGELTIVSNADSQPNLVVPIVANGASPCIKVSPETLDFSASLVNRDTHVAVRIESCGGELLTVSNVRLRDDSDDAYTLAEVPDEINLPAIDDPANPPSTSFDVIFHPTEELAYGGMLIIESNDPLRPELEIPIVGRGTINECPVPRVTQDEFQVRPLDVIVLDASPSTDADSPGGRPTRYSWEVVQAPPGSTQIPMESFHNPASPQDGGRQDDPSTPNAVFFVDLNGEYVINLMVVDQLDTATPSDQCPGPIAQIHVTARPEEDIHVELVWDTPSDDDQTDAVGSDVDLHVLHPTARQWSAAPLDCFYANTNPDWGPAGAVGNPSLDIDDTSGAGPENITVTDPEDTAALGGQYRVGVHYFRAIGFGVDPSLATVRIRLSGDLALEMEQNLQATDHFWEVASIIWTNAERRAQAINRYHNNVPR